MLDNLKITEVYRCLTSDDIFSRSWKAYCKLSEPVNTRELDRDQWNELIDVVCDQLDIYIKTHCLPGQYFAGVPSLYAVGNRLVVYQYAGYDV